MADIVGTRSDAQCRYRWRALENKRRRGLMAPLPPPPGTVPEKLKLAFILDDPSD